MDRRMALAGLLVVVAAGGCQWVSKGRLAACETRQRALAEQAEVQLAEIEVLKAHNRQLEDRLITAERDLAIAQRPE